jgi:integrase
MAKPRLGQSRQKPRARAKPRAQKSKPEKKGIIAEKNVSALVATMRSFGLDEGAVVATLFGGGLSEATRKGYSSAVRRVDRIAIAYGFPRGMRDRSVFLRYLLANVQLGIARGNSTMNHVRCALAHRQEMEGEEEWANTPFIKKAVGRHDTAGKRATVQQVATGAIPPAVVRGAVTADLLEKLLPHLQPPEAALLARLQFYGCLRPGEAFVLRCSCLTTNDAGDDAIIILSNKALRPSNARRVAAFQTRPISGATLVVLKEAIAAARVAGRTDDDALFAILRPVYTANFAAAVSLSIAEDHPGLSFVPHSLRHGCVADAAAKAAAKGLPIPDALIARFGMTRAIAEAVYAPPNALRVQRARVGGSKRARTDETSLVKAGRRLPTTAESPDSDRSSAPRPLRLHRRESLNAAAQDLGAPRIDDAAPSVLSAPAPAAGSTRDAQASGPVEGW